MLPEGVFCFCFYFLNQYISFKKRNMYSDVLYVRVHMYAGIFENETFFCEFWPFIHAQNRAFRVKDFLKPLPQTSSSIGLGPFKVVGGTTLKMRWLFQKNGERVLFGILSDIAFSCGWIYFFLKLLLWMGCFLNNKKLLGKPLFSKYLCTRGLCLCF